MLTFTHFWRLLKKYQNLLGKKPRFFFKKLSEKIWLCVQSCDCNFRKNFGNYEDLCKNCLEETHADSKYEDKIETKFTNKKFFCIVLQNNVFLLFKNFCVCCFSILSFDLETA